MSVTFGFELVTIRTVISSTVVDAAADTETIFHETVRLAMPQDHTLAEYLEIVNNQKFNLLTALDYDPEEFSLEIESIEIGSDEVLLLVDDEPDDPADSEEVAAGESVSGDKTSVH